MYSVMHYNCNTSALQYGGVQLAHKHCLGKQNLRDAEARWPGDIGRVQRRSLNLLSKQYGFSIALGDLCLLHANWYVTHSGLLRLATRRDVVVFQFDLLASSVTRRGIVLSLGPQSINHTLHGASSATAMLIPLIHRSLYAGPRCA